MQYGQPLSALQVSASFGIGTVFQAMMPDGWCAALPACTAGSLGAGADALGEAGSICGSSAASDAGVKEDDEDAVGIEIDMDGAHEMTRSLCRFIDAWDHYDQGEDTASETDNASEADNDTFTETASPATPEISSK
jgi:hypothetical protein